MMHRLRRYDVFRYAQNDVARFTRNDAMFAPMCPQAHIICFSVHHWEKPTSFAEGKHHDLTKRKEANHRYNRKDDGFGFR